MAVIMRLWLLAAGFTEGRGQNIELKAGYTGKCEISYSSMFIYFYRHDLQQRTRSETSQSVFFSLASWSTFSLVPRPHSPAVTC